MKTITKFIQTRIRFDRNELSGAFGDIGTDLPLIIGMRDMAPSKNNFVITVLVALAAVCLPHGYLIGMASGTALYYLQEKRDRKKNYEITKMEQIKKILHFRNYHQLVEILGLKHNILK